MMLEIANNWVRIAMFEYALEQMKKTGHIVSPPKVFQEYLAEQGLSNNKRTAQYISVQSLKTLNPELKANNCMVFRLGAEQSSKYTSFSLVKLNKDWSDFFLIDADLFSAIPLEIFLPSASVRSLFAFQLLPSLTEASLVNLALASGLLAKALEINATNELLIPATGSSTFTFDFKPISSSDTLLKHVNGQVEIDALFVGQRDGKECLFLVEAKSGNSFDSLSKHKLLYPLLALRQSIPSYMEIVPVYLRTIRNGNAIEFNIAECQLPVGGAVDQLIAKRAVRYSLHGY